jgi:hypothetical protein
MRLWRRRCRRRIAIRGTGWLVAQARLEGLSLVSADPVFATYGVDVVW